MSLRQKVDDELKAAMKASSSGHRERLDTIRMLKSAVKYREIELGQSLDDAGVAAVVGSLVKQRRDSAEQFRAGGRGDQATKEEAEITVLQEFLPAQLPPDELSALVEQAVLETKAAGPKDMGTVMKILKERVAGRADGKTLSDAVKARLAGIKS
jgi:uncharacterized protein YqeY